MLNNAVCFKNIYIVTGYTDLRFGIDSLAALIESKLGSTPFTPDTLYLFCGRRTDRIKGLVWESDGYLLLYKRLEQGNFQWPRTESDVRNLYREENKLADMTFEERMEHRQLTVKPLVDAYFAWVKENLIMVSVIHLIKKNIFVYS